MSTRRLSKESASANLLLRPLIDGRASQDEAEIEDNIRLLHDEISDSHEAVKAKIADYVA